MIAMRTLTAIIYPGETGRWLVAYNPETGTTTQSKTVVEKMFIWNSRNQEGNGMRGTGTNVFHSVEGN
jgi:hypothetical protein